MAQSVEQIRECARRGALHLDQVMPGWADGIDTATLNQHSLGHCIQAQLFGSYMSDHAADVLGEQNFRYAWRIDHGFAVDRDDDWRALTEAWIAEVEARTGSDLNEQIGRAILAALS